MFQVDIKTTMKPELRQNRSLVSEPAQFADEDCEMWLKAMEN